MRGGGRPRTTSNRAAGGRTETPELCVATLSLYDNVATQSEHGAPKLPPPEADAAGR